MASGIYRIDGPNGKYYVGSAKNISRRWIEHRRDLRSCRHASPKLQCAWTRHGEDAFRFSVIELVEELEMLLPREQYWIDTLDAVAKGYNVLITAGSSLGSRHSEETKRKQSAAHKGRKHGPMSEEQKAYYSSLYRGRKLSEETRKRMSESRTGAVFSDTRRANLSASLKGITKTAEHREKLAAANRGKKQSLETIEKRKTTQKQTLLLKKQQAQACTNS